MPELPEVETTRRHLAPVLEGARIVDVTLTRDRMARRNTRPVDVVDRLEGRLIGSVGRRGKFLLIDVEGDLTWVIHLGMSGRVRIAENPGEPRETHAHFTATTDRGPQVRLIDPRTFGFVAVFTPDELATDSLSLLGPDAWEDLPKAPTLHSRLTDRRVPLKALLLDQRELAGLGNIYADEVLFRAGVRPDRVAGSVTSPEVDRLLDAIPVVLAAGIESGGTSLDDLAYLLPDGRAGEFLSQLAVYGRAGQPCRRCGSAIERVIVAQRSSHFCPRCQT